MHVLHHFKISGVPTLTRILLEMMWGTGRVFQQDQPSIVSKLARTHRHVNSTPTGMDGLEIAT